jgi:hypothetical protein
MTPTTRLFPLGQDPSYVVRIFRGEKRQGSMCEITAK